jgi:hypothetical protein
LPCSLARWWCPKETLQIYPRCLRLPAYSNSKPTE